MFIDVVRYASLYFCMCINQDDNELEVLEIIHQYVETLDRYFGSVSLFIVKNEEQDADFFYELKSVDKLLFCFGALFCFLNRFVSWT